METCELEKRIKMQQLFIPGKMGFKHFRFKLGNSKFQSIKRSISNYKELDEDLKEYCPKHAYYSICDFLEPMTLQGKIKRKGYLDVLLSFPLVFDVDSDGTLEDMENARKKAIKILKVMQKENKEPYLICFSGRGFHLYYKNPVELLPDCRKRIQDAIQKRKVFISVIINKYAELKDKGKLIFDKNVTANPYGIIRVPGTLNPKTNLVCTLLKKEELFMSIQQIIKRAKPKNYPYQRSAISSNGKMSRGFPRQQSKEGVSRLTSASPYNVSYISNVVLGLKKPRFVPIFKYPKTFSLSEIKKEIFNLIKKYDLTSTFVIETENFKYALCLKTFDKARLRKIYNASKSYSKIEFTKYGKNFMEISTWKKKREHVKICGLLISKNNKSFCSKGHLKFIELMDSHYENTVDNPTHGNKELQFSFVTWKGE